MFKLNHHLFLLGFATLLGSFYNTYFYYFISPNASLPILLGIGAFLIILLAFALELLCFIPKMTKIITFLILVIASFSSFPINVLHIGITDDLLSSIIQANPREIKESLNLAFIWHIFLTLFIPLPLLFILKLQKISIWRDLKTKLIFIVSYSLILSGLWFGAIGKDLTFLFKKDRALYYIINPISPIRSSVQFLQSLQLKSLSYTQVGLDATLLPRSKPKAVVLVIGESARSQNFSLNGYTKPTNPYTSKQDSLISFQDFSSCGVITAISVPCMLSDYTHKTYTNRNLSKYRDSLLDITQRSGIQTYYIGNNGGGCVGDFCMRLPKNQTKFYNDGNLDGVMLKDLSSILSSAKNDVFIILHQMGSHGQGYFQRYPKEFKIFTPTCESVEIQNCSYEELVNTYDNTLVYTDFVINSAIEELKKIQNRFDVALWYISDHGESLGERGMYMHGGLPYFLAPDTQTKIPSILWLSGGGGYNSLKSQENAPLSHDYVFHTLLHLLGIKTNAYDPNLDILKGS